MGESVKDVQFKELDSVVWPSGCEASKHMDEVKVARVDGLVKAGEPAPAPTSLETVQEQELCQDKVLRFEGQLFLLVKHIIVPPFPDVPASIDEYQAPRFRIWKRGLALEIEAEEQPEPYSVFDVSAFVKGNVVDTSEGVDPPSLATKVARVVAASLGTVQELVKEIESSKEQIQAQNGLDDALKRRLQKLIDSNRVMLFMKGTPEEPKCRFSKMAVKILKKHKVEFGSFDLLTDNEVLEGIQKYSNWSLLPQIYFKGRARGFRHIGTLMKGCSSESTGENIFY
ncbi:monothiol glutaredoxin-S17-like [Prunus avium]|uniref:Monothiol glutaredoxin-S17-like n=1 Tax=Prunus avium TaxID=42229 RepID=A0A6P5U3Q8_PRUAV|nr:monothiol glutaredoxin-S17-like [Prunus avium]